MNASGTHVAQASAARQRPVIYHGEQASLAARYINEEYPDDDPWKPAGDGFWTKLPCRTAWDVAMGGRQPLRWSDTTLIEQAEALYGADAFEHWLRCCRRSALAQPKGEAL